MLDATSCRFIQPFMLFNEILHLMLCKYQCLKCSLYMSRSDSIKKKIQSFYNIVASKTRVFCILYGVFQLFTDDGSLIHVLSVCLMYIHSIISMIVLCFNFYTAVCCQTVRCFGESLGVPPPQSVVLFSRNLDDSLLYLKTFTKLCYKLENVLVPSGSSMMPPPGLQIYPWSCVIFDI